MRKMRILNKDRAPMRVSQLSPVHNMLLKHLQDKDDWIECMEGVHLREHWVQQNGLVPVSGLDNPYYLVRVVVRQGKCLKGRTYPVSISDEGCLVLWGECLEEVDVSESEMEQWVEDIHRVG